MLAKNSRQCGRIIEIITDANFIGPLRMEICRAFKSLSVLKISPSKLTEFAALFFN